MASSNLAFIVAGIVIGIASGTLGLGGAVMLVPTLVYPFGFSQARAQGTSIGALVPPIGVLAALQYWRNGLLDVRAALLIGAGFVFGALGGATLVPFIPQTWLKRGFATMLVYVAANMVLGENRRMGSVLPGVIGMGALWVAYFAKKALGKRPKPPEPPVRPPDTEYFI